MSCASAQQEGCVDHSIHVSTLVQGGLCWSRMCLGAKAASQARGAPARNFLCAGARLSVCLWGLQLLQPV